MLKIGNITLKDLEDGLILKMITEPCIHPLWKHVGGFLNKYMIKEEFIENVKLCLFLGLPTQFFQILKLVQTIRKLMILL